ncbi:MAG: succinate dehydrogenase assembly factor 2, partial [Mariprofundaceae bacterium]|nr:succinate dehydrogenase assembly factor 2 [Mariprofundaceae bacterium]
DRRRLRHRLKCLGMAELDVWLSPLNEALLSNDEAIIAEIDRLLQRESPELFWLMHHPDEIPKLLRPWLLADN